MLFEFAGKFAFFAQRCSCTCLQHALETGLFNDKTLLYKTQMCANILTLGYCKYGSECWFAHRVNELRSVPSNSSNTQHFSKSSNGRVFDFMSETFQHQQPCTSSSISANTTTEGSAPRLFSESHIEEAFYSSNFVDEESRDAFRRPLVAIKLGRPECLRSVSGNLRCFDPFMNIVVENCIEHLEGMEVGTSGLLKEGCKQCEYVSNRTRLRCQNVRRSDDLKTYGFCEEHRGFIERIKQQGLRAKHCFDACQNFLPLINDDDETLMPRHPADFPFVYESLYCDNRMDDIDNPLSRANVFAKREIQMRIIYREKHRRTLHQISTLKKNAQLTKLDPAKDVRKIARVLAMRQYLFSRHNWDRILQEKIVDHSTMATAALRHQKGKEEDASQMCARINRPWDGTRHKGGNFTFMLSERINNNGTSGKKTPMVPANNTNNNNNNIYASYQQYLSLQHLIPGVRSKN
uniref:C3H1-type domain-containing protein n=1 Tax=Globodera rostochiensis TaxID=31243 RepID=A0A914I9G0_GLORO